MLDIIYIPMFLLLTHIISKYYRSIDNHVIICRTDMNPFTCRIGGGGGAM